MQARRRDFETVSQRAPYIASQDKIQEIQCRQVVIGYSADMDWMRCNDYVVHFLAHSHDGRCERPYFCQTPCSERLNAPDHLSVDLRLGVSSLEGGLRAVSTEHHRSREGWGITLSGPRTPHSRKRKALSVQIFLGPSSGCSLGCPPAGPPLRLARSLVIASSLPHSMV